MATIEKRLEQLEQRTASAGDVFCIRGEAEDGSQQYLNTVTGEITDTLPPRGVVISYIRLDLTAI